MTDRLNPDALEAGAKAMYNEEPWQKSTYSVESYSWEEIREEDRQAFREEAEVAVSAYLAALPAPRAITTIAELEALPVGVVVIDPYAAVCVRQYDMDFWGDWKRVTTAVAGGAHNHKPYLPARVLWVPTEVGGE